MFRYTHPSGRLGYLTGRGAQEMLVLRVGVAGGNRLLRNSLIGGRSSFGQLSSWRQAWSQVIGKRVAGSGIASLGQDGTAIAVSTSMLVGLERSPAAYER